MPSIRSIEKLSDGFRIVRASGAVLARTSADVPTTVKTTTDAETWINQWLTTQGWNALCHVNTIAPLDVNIVISDRPLTAAMNPANVRFS